MDNFRLVFDYILEINGTDNIFWIFYVLNLVLSVIAFELGFAKKLPILKTVIVYIMLLIGVFIITIFSTVMRMPSVESLIVINLVLAIYRTRLHFQRKNKKENTTP
ncbi:YlaH-like family protein [Oceanobacillus senegalensis]|uniref:YlaH-like family protein n=1 Tax=Oceanobacillus senegalensis TaxID=1936063 RepID=UPI000A30BE1D|nr:YlaH-like family protein [Oceanobacillus senegalensis]